MKRGSTTQTFEPAEGMAFFVLDEQGVLFSEKRQDLLLLDAAASYVWSCLQDGLSFTDIATGYAEACELRRSDADRIVGDLLHRWMGLHYIRGNDIPSSSPIDLTTALGRLLVNPDLRGAFAADPRSTADRLRLRERDVPPFIDIEPTQLELLARTISAELELDRHSTSTAEEAISRSAILRYQTRRWTSPSVEQFYRLGGTTLRIRYETLKQKAIIHGTLLHLETAPASPDMSLDVIMEKQGHVILKDGEPAAYCTRLDYLARTVLVLIRDTITDRTDYFLFIHAGIVSTGDACILFPAAPGSGKSTLTAALARSGFQFFTDEIAMLDDTTMQARPFPFPVVVKEGSVEPLKPFYPEVSNLPVSLRDNDQPVRYLPLHASSLPVTGEAHLPVRWIVFPRYDATAETALRPLRSDAALARMLQECRMVNARLDTDNITGLIEWFRGTACFDLPLSSLPDAIQLLQGLCFPPRPGEPEDHP